MELARGTVWISPGARAAEEALIAALRPMLEAARASPRLLARPVRIVVPSRSLREHLAARLVRSFGGGVAGVAVSTAWAIAGEIVARAGPLPNTAGGRRLFPVLVRRLAVAEPALRQVVEPFAEGHTPVAASVGDLLDAGLEEGLAEGVFACLDAAASGVVRERAGALVRIALAVRTELAALGLAHPSVLLRRAAELVDAGSAGLPARAVFVHGFADTTGALGDLLEALALRAGAQVWIDEPPDPASPSQPSPCAAFTRRLRARLGALGRRELAAAPAGAPGLRLVEAPGASAEARFVAEEIRRLLDAGGSPEGIAVVARDLTPYRAALRAHFGRLSVPFSGGPGFARPAARRPRALLELLERGAASPADRWLDASDRHAQLPLADLRLALHAMGIGRLRDVASLDLEVLLGERTHYALPVRHGLRPVAPGEEGEGAEELPQQREATARRRKVSREALAAAVETARALVAQLEALGARATLAAQLAALRRLLLRELAWGPDTPGCDGVQAALAQLEREIGGSVVLSAPELLVVLRAAFAEVGESPLGGEGGGVQVLRAVEARSRSFDHLFLLGMNRDVFPRVASEDPLLSDDLRRCLESVLPDIPVKARGADEERHLFAELCSGAGQAVVSWQALSDDGRERARSPLVERLRLVTGLSCETAPPLLGERDARIPRPALEHAVHAGLAGDRQALAASYEVALADAGHGERAAAVAALRRAVLEEFDPAPGTAASRRLGPWFGLIGPPAEADPRHAPLHVTQLEGLHHCPWQTFLAKLLRLEPVPDALAALPDATPLLLGSVVHAVLEEIVARAGAATALGFDEARARGPADVPWPGAGELEALLRAAAVQVSRDEGIVLPGFAALLARRAKPLLLRLRELEWGEAGVRRRVLGAELSGRVDLAAHGGAKRTLHFRADRVDVDPAGLVLTDYKTGGAVSGAKRPETRRRHLLEQVSSGRLLQAAAYALGERDAVAGRYVFAKEGVPDEAAVVSVAREDAALAACFGAAARALVSAWEAGAFAPRLIGAPSGDDGPVCRRCELVDACLRGDSGSRRRLRTWLETTSEGESALLRAARGLFPEGAAS
jgi:hypothetical protein